MSLLGTCIICNEINWLHDGEYKYCKYCVDDINDEEKNKKDEEKNNQFRLIFNNPNEEKKGGE